MRRRLGIMAATVALGLVLATVSGAGAQDDPGAGEPELTATTAVDSAAETVDDETDDSGRWGLLGLAGLAGLAGLLKRPTQTVVERDTTVRTEISTRR